ncbi:MAG: M1 family aminopeptidase [Gemmataceae bacterium]
MNFYPLYRIPKGDTLLLAKTLELLRLDPSSGIDLNGQHGSIQSVALKPANGAARPLDFHQSTTNPTAVIVQLSQPVGPGETVTVELAGQIRLPNKQGRWGQWDGVTFLTNALPVVAFYDDRGWHDVPFVPWHQPFWNEAGVYTATITLPTDEKLACSAPVKDTADLGDGRVRVTMAPFVGRDFAIVCSSKFLEYTGTANLPDGRAVPVRCLAQRGHEHYAREMLRISAEALAMFSQWLGPYPADQFTLVESFFGWNGNESAGLVMIDERVFDMPKLGRGYIEYLVSHETCHQWWYNLVGTNGYSETFLDEGAATYFTHRLMDLKHGKNNDLLAWPKEVSWLPNIKRENYRFASLTGAIRRGDEQPAAGDLPQFGHLVGLFSGAYDRGSKVFGMIETRLGAEFLPFTRMLVAKYSWRVLSVAQLKAELVTFTGEATTAQWDQLFDRWVYDKGLTDWRVDEVHTKAVGPRAGGSGVPVEVVVSQHREFDEPTVVGFQLADGDGFPVRVPVGGGVAHAENGASVEPLGDGKYRVRLTLPSEPTQVTVDPDRVLLDANLGDNDWKPRSNFRLVPLYTMLNETDLTNDYDRWNFAAGPWVWGPSYPDPWYTRSTMAGVRAGAFRTQTFAGGVYAAARYDYRDFVIGADGVFDHWPTKNTQVGFNVEQRVAGPWFDDGGSQTAFRGVLSTGGT